MHVHNEDRTLTADALVDIETPSEINVSSSGLKVVYSLSSGTKKLDKEFVSSIWLADIGIQYSSRQITSGLFKDESPKFSPDGKSVAFISDRAVAGKSSAIYLISMDGGEAFPITKSDNKQPITSFQWSPNGKFIAFTSADEKGKDREAKDKEKDDAKVYGEDWEYSRLRLVHVTTKETSNLFDQALHVDKFTWSKQSAEIIFTVQRTPDINSPFDGIEFRAASLSDRDSITLAKFPGPVYDLLEGERIYFIAGTSPKSVSTSRMLYQLRTSTSEQNEIVKVCFGEDDCAMELRSPTPCFAAIRVQEGLSDKIYRISHILSPPSTIATIHDEPFELSTWDIAEVESEDEECDIKTVLCFGKSEGESPTEIFSKVDSGEIVQLSNHSSAIADLHVMKATSVICDAPDGTTLDAVFYTPSGGGKNLATVVLVHGGPYYRSSTSFDSSSFHWAPWLVSAGYAVLCPNYRGSSGYGEKFASASKAGMGTKDYDDVISLLKKAIELGYVDENRVGIGGWSQGGFLSYLAVTRPDFKFRGAVCGAGVSDWDTMSFTSDAHAFEAELAGGAPWEKDAESTNARRGSAVWHMKDVKTPILILHGEDDKRVPLYNAIGFHRGCLHYGIDCELVIYPREGHPIHERQHRVDMLKRIRRFYDIHV